MTTSRDIEEAISYITDEQPTLVEEPTPVKVEHKPTVMSKLMGSVDVPEEFKFADNVTFYTMLRNIFRGKSIMITGPSGCGKSSLGKILAGITSKPFYAFNFGDTMNPSAKLLGDRHMMPHALIHGPVIDTPCISMLNASPQAHFDGKNGNGQPYLKGMESQNSRLVR